MRKILSLLLSVVMALLMMPLMPSAAAQDEGNGDYYIRAVPQPAGQPMAFPFDEKLSASNPVLEFTLSLDDARAAGTIVFNPVERTLRSAADYMASIGFSAQDGVVFNETASDLVLEAQTAYAFRLDFDFEHGLYDVTVNGVEAARDVAFQYEGTNVYSIGVANVSKGSYDVRAISQKALLVDNDAIKAADELNPSYRPDGGTVYHVGPTRRYQKPQDVLLLAETGDTILVEGGTVYPASLQITGDVAQGITIKGVKKDGKRPKLASGGVNNLVVLTVDGTVLEGFELEGFIKTALEARGMKLEDIREEGLENYDWISYRGVFVTDGPDDVVIRDCEVYYNQQGIQGTAGDILIEYCDIHHNGFHYSGHNIYLDSELGKTGRFQYNYIHHTLTTSNGLKTRMAKNEVYYNYFYNDQQAMELIGHSDGSAPRDSEVVGNLIVSDDAFNMQGMRIGGDGTGAGTSGRYRIANNTFAFMFNAEAYPIRLNTNIECVEVYNNIFYSQGDAGKEFPIFPKWGTEVWVSGEARFVGENNWVSRNATEIDELTGTLIGDAPGFIDPLHLNFNLQPDSALIGKGAAAGTVHEWVPFEGMRKETAFADPLTELSSQPVDPKTLKAAGRTDKKAPDIGAYGYEGSEVRFGIVAGIR